MFTFGLTLFQSFVGQPAAPEPRSSIKAWSELSSLVKTYFCFSIVSLLALLGLTVSSIYKQHKNTEVSDEDNFTVSLVQLVGILFCIYYISRGVLQENRQELVVFVLSVLVVMIRSVVNFSVVGSEGKQEVLLCSLWILKVVVLPCQRGAGGTGGRVKNCPLLQD
ncbi:hypothetical protein AMECASPLE_028471 [Ameca splendens]|uniref:DUF7789 domain-containing protein n=1 Tax=Ameca splendens TaxID=208324 RepID=A0ABV0YTD9_9TELE